MGEQIEKSVLAVDVGNGSTRFGLFSAGDVIGSIEVSTPPRITRDEARMLAQDVLFELCDGEAPHGAILSCVVPSHLDAWAKALTEVAATRALVVGPGLKTGIRMRVDDPSGVGSDRVANALAAREALGSPAVAVHLGTTTNLEVVDDSGAFVGGAIAPGVLLGVSALARGAARLPMVELRAPSSVIGKNTREAMQAGVVTGAVILVDGLLEEVFSELGREAPVVLTGRYANGLAPLLRHEVVVDELLALRGLALIWYANRG